MPLKRGQKRGSCDFCYRRQIKCDQRNRAAQGFDACSQCDSRREHCRVNDSDDIHIQRHRRATPRGANADIETRGRQAIPDSPHCNTQDQPSRSSASMQHSGSMAPAALDHTPPLQYPNEFFFDDAFSLSNDSLFFLEQVFTGDSLPPEWSNDVSTANEGSPTPDTTANTIANGRSGGTVLDGMNPDLTGDDHSSCSWLDGLANADTIIAAMRVYFDVAASYLPILFEDAFWTDYHAGRCSSSLRYAVACRGMPFTRAVNKWELQQQLARRFRETFLEARAAVIDEGAVGLDDLEALALMIDFDYDNAASAPIHGNLGRLFLTHGSLVLMMLQSQKHEHSTSDAQSSALPSRAKERRVLLYWHVYGIDAFHCLDRKQQSHIPDIDAVSNGSISQHEAKDYFDAILALAIVARNITKTLCNAAAKRKGVSTNDITLMYEQLALWRLHSCPQHLRRQRDSAGNLIAGNNNYASARGTARELDVQLRRAVLWALEVNCTMQIEACVSDWRRSRLPCRLNMRACAL